MSLERTNLRSGYDVPRLVVGLWQLSEGHQRRPTHRGEALSTLARLADSGFTTFDCADIYTGVETLLGEFRAGYVASRGGGAPPLRIHTKFVPNRDALASLDRRHVERIIDRSLARLGVDRLDLVQFAWWDYAVPGYVETALWLDELRETGKIRLLGVTNFDVTRLQEIVEAGVPVATNQVQYSLLDRRVESGMAEFCATHDIRLLCYGTLGGGFLSRRYLRAEPPEPPFANRSLTKYRLMIDEAGGWGRFQDLLDIMGAIARDHDCAVAQVALRWVLDRPSVASAIVGFADTARLEVCADALDLRLSEEDHSLLAGWAASGPMPGGDVFELEREPGGAHASIMRYDLNA